MYLYVAFFFAKAHSVYKFHKNNKTYSKHTLIEPTFMIGLCTSFVSKMELLIELASRKQCNTKQLHKSKKSLHITKRKPSSPKPMHNH